MNKTIFRALAIVVASSLAYAGSESEEWLSLDKELAKLNSSVSQQGGGPLEFDGFLRTSYEMSSDLYEVTSGNDLGGFSIDNVRLNVHGGAGDFGYYVQLEGAGLPTPPSVDEIIMVSPPRWAGGFGIGGGVDVLDAYATWSNEQLTVTAGQFRPAFFHSSRIEDNNLLFMDRTVIGDTFAFRDQGLMLSGVFDQLAWWIGLQNGMDTVGNEYSMFGRVEFDAMGEGNDLVEGAAGAPEETSLTVGVAYIADDTLGSDYSAFGADAYLTSSGFTFAAEFLREEAGSADATTWDATGGYMFVPDEWEIAARYEDFEGDDLSIWSAAVNRYMSGHDAKFQLTYSNWDLGPADISVVSLGFTVGN